MIQTIRVEVFVEEEYSERERAILHTLLLNISSLSNALLTGESLALNPVPESKATLSVELLFQSAINGDQALQLAKRIKRITNNSFKMSELAEPKIEMKTMVSES